MRSWWRSSSKTTSRTDVEPALDSPVSFDPGCDGLGPGIGHEQRADPGRPLDVLAALDRQKVVTTRAYDPLSGVHLNAYRISGDHHPVQVEGFEQLAQGGDLWLDLTATRCWVRTVPVDWSRASRR